MRFRSFLPVLCILLFCSLHMYGQTAQEPATDTTSAMESQPDEEQEISTEDETAVLNFDTSLVDNKHVLATDSIRLLKNSKSFAYAKNLDSLLKDYQQKQQQKADEVVPDSKPSWLEAFFSSNITQLLFWGLAIFFIGFIIVKLFITEGFFQRQTARSNVSVIKETDDKDFKDSNYDALAAAAAKDQQFRLATRYLYLQLLQKLSKAGAIQFSVDKTNSEYLAELTGKAYKQDVAMLTLNYEYVWYGEFAIDATAYARLENRFKKLAV